ncbi:cytochrome c oxidase assembly protein [Aureimonas frigidaquae]|uniref:cytochrome c oxidase assembly protein n=1 Tax=Aureimonas frigidaquae TaxID=424757 RepID=UPI0007810FCD|nr:cytochrome c oxidase assembly protein [Aureimonas frigidaquae]
MNSTISVPFCGTAPVPGELWTRWALDPVLLAGLGLVPAIFAYLQKRSGGQGSTRLFLIGWAVLLIAFVSPLCAASAALFSARVAHHVLLVAVAAPLFALANPYRGQMRLSHPGFWLLLHAVLLWFWHAPMPYAAALGHDGIYWLMQASLIGSAFLFWAAALEPREGGFQAAVLMLAAMMQMGLLGALITFAPRPLYAAHFLAPEAFGLSALSDQQLAGLIMWAPGALPYLVAALIIVSRALNAPGEGARP